MNANEFPLPEENEKAATNWGSHMPMSRNKRRQIDRFYKGSKFAQKTANHMFQMTQALEVMAYQFGLADVQNMIDELDSDNELFTWETISEKTGKAYKAAFVFKIEDKPLLQKWVDGKVAKQFELTREDFTQGFEDSQLHMQGLLGKMTTLGTPMDV
jgi:hypothetical protein